MPKEPEENDNTKGQKDTRRDALQQKPTPTSTSHAREFYVATPHDALVKRMLSDQQYAYDLLRIVLPKPLVKRIAINSVTLEPTNSIGPKFNQMHNDLVIKGRLDGQREVQICVLLEHQSTEKPDVILRLLMYSERILERWYRTTQGDTEKLPLILPVVLYHGDKPWRGPKELLDVYPLSEEEKHAVRGHALNFGLIVDDLAQATEAELLAQGQDAPAVGLMRLVLKHGTREKDLVSKAKGWDTLSEQLAHDIKGRHALENVLTYSALASPNVDGEKMAHALHFYDKEIDMRWAPLPGSTGERILAEVAQKNLKKGRQEGRQEGSADTLLKLLQLKFRDDVTPDVQARVHQATQEELDRWTESVLTAASLHKLLGI